MFSQLLEVQLKSQAPSFRANFRSYIRQNFFTLERERTFCHVFLNDVMMHEMMSRRPFFHTLTREGVNFHCVKFHDTMCIQSKILNNSQYLFDTAWLSINAIHINNYLKKICHSCIHPINLAGT